MTTDEDKADCPFCLDALLAAADEEDASESWRRETMWCPRCDRRFIVDHFGDADPVAVELPASPPVSLAAVRDIARGSDTRTTEPPYEATVTRDGSVRFTFNGGAPVAVTPEYAHRIVRALMHVAYEADLRLKRLRGANRWIASQHPRRPDAIRVRHDDEEATFVPVKIRKPHECHSCRQKSAGPVMWREEPRAYDDVPEGIRGPIEPGTSAVSCMGASWKRWQFGSWARLCSACAAPVVRGLVDVTARAAAPVSRGST